MLVLSLILSFILFGQANPPTSAQVPPGYVEMNGEKSPQSIPDWLAWQNSFAFLAAASNQPESRLYDELTSSLSERKVIESAARAVRAREESCEREQIQTWERLKGVERSQIRSQVRQQQIGCRTEVLNAKDRLLPQLSRETLQRVLAFVEANRSGIKALVPKAEIDHFRRPK